MDGRRDGHARPSVRPGWRDTASPCAPDFHLFEDWDFSVDQNILNTSSLPVGDPRRYDDGTQHELSRAMRRTWATNPSGERIVEDMTRYPLVIDKIVECKGGIVPDCKAQHAGCSKRKRKTTEGTRLYAVSPGTAAVAAVRREELLETAKRLAYGGDS